MVDPCRAYPLMSHFLLSQVLAAIALGCGAVSFKSRTRRSILLWLLR